MALLDSRNMCFSESSGGAFDHLCVDSSRVCSLASFELVDGVAEFLHRELIHCIWYSSSFPRVRVRASSSLTCRAPVELREHVCNVVSCVS